MKNLLFVPSLSFSRSERASHALTNAFSSSKVPRTKVNVIPIFGPSVPPAGLGWLPSTAVGDLPSGPPDDTPTTTGKHLFQKTTLRCPMSSTGMQAMLPSCFRCSCIICNTLS